MYQSSVLKRFFGMLQAFDDLDGVTGTRGRDEIRENDVVFIDTKAADYEGHICITKVTGEGKSHYQRVYMNGETITLCCPTDGDITGVYALKDVTIEGKVTGVYRPLPSVEMVDLAEHSKMFESIKRVQAGGYDIRPSEIRAIATKNGGGNWGCISDAFEWGFIKGERAAKARAKERRAREHGKAQG